MMYRKVCFRVNDCTRIEGLFQHRAAGKKKPERHNLRMLRNLRAARAVRDKPERRNLRTASCAPQPAHRELCAASCALRNLLLTDGE